MTRLLYRIGLVVALFAALHAGTAQARTHRSHRSHPARKHAAPEPIPVAVQPVPPPPTPLNQPEPEPAPLVPPPDQPEPEPEALEPPEPEPAPLLPQVEALRPEQIEAELAKKRRSRQVRVLRGFAWTGAALTMSLFAAGSVLGGLAEQRSDALSSATAVPLGQVAPVFDAGQSANYLGLQSDGRTFNTATIACFTAGTALAAISGVLFWRAAKLDPNAKLRVALTPAVSANASGGLIGLGGSF